MKISVISSFYNGDPMIPYFMNHYGYADEIVAMFNDNGRAIDAPTEQAILSHPNARIVGFDYPENKADYAFAINNLNQMISKIDADWLISVQGDELIFPIGMQDVREVLRDADGVIINTWLWWIFRHRTDLDLDPTLPAIWQRRHGYPGREFFGAIKPSIVKPSAGITYSIGAHNCHAARGNLSSIRFDGAHWLNADPDMAVKRRMRGRRENVSKRSLNDGMGSHMFDITEKQILAECEKYLDAPQVF
ncbi:MAG: hypothetical protein IMZ57_02300 [Acidobacteria bacterium]|nr:hypothetical protein [Acidobacteriota bacterium]